MRNIWMEINVPVEISSRSSESYQMFDNTAILSEIFG